MGWSFAIVNGKLAEIFFHHKKNGEPVIEGFCYVKASEYKTKREKQHIKIDTVWCRFLCVAFPSWFCIRLLLHNKSPLSPAHHSFCDEKIFLPTCRLQLQNSNPYSPEYHVDKIKKDMASTPAT